MLLRNMLSTASTKSSSGAITIGRKGFNQFRLPAAEVAKHTAVFGDQTNYKRELLLDFVRAAAAGDAGALFVDESGDPTVRKRFTDICCQNGRQSDIRILDFCSSAPRSKTMVPPGTNSFNPFAMGSADQLTQMMVSLMDDTDGDGIMWKGKAIAMFTGMMRPLTWLRDQEVINFNVGTIRDCLNLKIIIDLADPKIYPEMPLNIRKAVRSYLTSLPGYQEDKGHKQAQTTLDQHGYLEMQFTKILGALADVYGHVFSGDQPSINFDQVMEEGLMLLVLVPAATPGYDKTDYPEKIITSVFQQAVSNRIEGAGGQSDRKFHAILGGINRYIIDGMRRTVDACHLANVSLTVSTDSPWVFGKRDERISSELARIISNRIYLAMNSPDADRHILDLPLPAKVRRRMMNMPADLALFLNDSQARWIDIKQPEPDARA